MYFLIDYENVKGEGFSGIEYLSDNDMVVIFYSSYASSVEKGIWDRLCDSGCAIDICKLIQARKNALDFYIACRVGELMNKDPSGMVAIISRDNGFLSVVDYWKQYRREICPVVLAETISGGILASKEDSDRMTDIYQSRKKVDIETAYKTHFERRILKDRVRNLLLGSEYEDKVEEVFQIVEKPSSGRDRYIGTLKVFGKQDGLKIYQFVKRVG